MAEEKLHNLEIQHNLLTAVERSALASALANATVQGHAGLSRVLLTLMSMTAGGRITSEQAENLTKMAELLFTNICAQQIQASMDSKGTEEDEDPLVARLLAAQAGAKKVQPRLLLDDNGDHEYGLEVLDAQGKAVPLPLSTD